MHCCFFCVILSSACVQDRCSAGEVVAVSGSAGLLWSPVGQRAGHSHGATPRLCLYSLTFWPHGLTESADAHVGLRPPCSGEYLCWSARQHLLWSTPRASWMSESLLLLYFSFPLLCLSPGEASLPFSARLKRLGAEEHAGNPAVLLPLCHVPGRPSNGCTAPCFWTAVIMITFYASVSTDISASQTREINK